jgi:hypothetical protein
MALKRAVSTATENAYRFHAFTNATWGPELDFGFVEEEARESYVHLSVSFRRAMEIVGLKKSDLPTVLAVSKKPGVFESINLAEFMNVGAHLQYFKFHLGARSEANETLDVGYVNARSDDRGVYFEPSGLVLACLATIPKLSSEAFEGRMLQEANQYLKEAN